jgi:prepilin-type N-terminal cleavage/methylation domain-containing protein/prepilin-type processing-associated H-X9-DG protein
MTTDSRRRSGGFTLIELLVVIAIMAILIGMTIPAVQKVRESAHRARCLNNLKQISLGFKDAHDALGKLPPGIGWYPGSGPNRGNAYGTAGLHLLPYIDQDPLYRRSKPEWATFYYALFGDIYQNRVKIFVCPSDPSYEDGGIVMVDGVPWGACSYAVNAQVFCKVDDDGRLVHPQYHRRLTQITDGTSQTILVAEKYAHGTNYAYPEGGSLWAYWYTGGTHVDPLHAAFAVDWNPQYSIGPGSKFLVQPKRDDCDPTLASTPHSSGMQVAMADGSVRNVSPGVSGETWWWACTPTGDEVLGSDW